MSNATEARLDSEEKGWCGENANSWLQVDLGKYFDHFFISIIDLFHFRKHVLKSISKRHNFSFYKNEIFCFTFYSCTFFSSGTLNDIVQISFSLTLHCTE